MNNQDTRQWLEEQLPDFCFHRLSEQEALRFSEEVKQFPDLQEEVRNVQQLFSGLEEIEIRSGYDSKLKNLSYNVVENYSYTKNTYFKRPSFAAITSAFVIGIVIFGYYSLPINDSNSTKMATSYQNSNATVETATFTDDVDMLNAYDSQTLESLDEFEEEIVESTIQSMEPKTAFVVTNANPMSLPVHSLKSLEEPEIVDLITTLENEDFSL